MNDRDETDSLTRDTTSETSGSHLDRGTMVGCAGILLMLTPLALLYFLPLDLLALPAWLGNLLPLLGVGAMMFGAYLVFQVPSHNTQAQSPDPRYPLTISGRSPLLEQPAERKNRVTLIFILLLVTVAIAGYGFVSFAPRPWGIVVGMLLVSIAGYSFLVSGALVAGQYIPAPAWHWVRTPIQSELAPQTLSLVLVGLATLGWGLILGVENRHVFLPLGLGILLLVVMGIARILQRPLGYRKRSHR
jgi:hypothetical protein